MSADLQQQPSAGPDIHQNVYIICCKLPNGFIFKSTPWGDVPLQGAKHAIIAGHGMTRVPVEIWNWIYATYAEADVIKNGIIFAAATVEDATALSKERVSNKTGMEQKSPKAIIKDAEKKAGNAIHPEIKGFVEED